MDIAFKNNQIRKICNSEKKARQKLGTRNAERLMRRLLDLRAAENLDQMSNLPGRVHPLKGSRAGEYSLDLEHPYRLLFKPDHDPLPEKPDGGLARKQVTAILITEIADTHG